MALPLLLWAIAALVIVLLVLRVIPMCRDIRRMNQVAAGVPRAPLSKYLEFAVLSHEDIYDKMNEMVFSSGPNLCGWLGPHFLFLIGDPDDVETVLTSSKQIDKPELYSALEPVMGQGLITVNGSHWRRHRKAISPSLHLDILHDFVHVFSCRGLVLAQRLEEAADADETLDVTPLCGLCSNTSVCETVLSMDKIGDEKERQQFVDSVPKALDHFIHRLLYPWYVNETLFSWSKRFPEYVQLKNFTDNYITEIIKKKKEQISKSVNQEEAPKRRRQAFLDHILSSPEGAVLSQAELLQEVKTMVGAASSTSMDALSILFYTLAIRQDIQNKVVQELDDIFGEDVTREVVDTDLPHMQYTERVIKETFRYFTVVPYFARRCKEDIPLPSGYTAPRGCILAFWVPYVHMNPRWFPEPKKFDPDRFLPENSRGRHPFSFIPFSAGPRNCIGQRYAMMFLKTVLATVLRRVRILPSPGTPSRLEDVKVSMTLTTTIRGGSIIRTERRRKLSQVEALAA